VTVVELAVCLVTAASGGNERFLFEDRETWVLTDGLGTPLERFASFDGLHAIEADVSSDGNAVVFTAHNDEASNTLLYIWRRADGRAHLLGRPYGFHAQPRFSRDGEWVTFGHNPGKGGRPGQHQPGANSQLHRIRIDGTRLDTLTSTPGCKLSPVTIDAFRFFYVHSSCDIGAALATTDAGGRERLLTPYDAKYDELTLTDDQTVLVATQNRLDEVAFSKVSLSNGTKTTIYTTERRGRAVHPHWSNVARAVLFQSGSEIWTLHLDGKAIRTSNISVQE
jgi:hypothetical protein